MCLHAAAGELTTRSAAVTHLEQNDNLLWCTSYVSSTTRFNFGLDSCVLADRPVELLHAAAPRLGRREDWPRSGAWRARGRTNTAGSARRQLRSWPNGDNERVTSTKPPGQYLSRYL